MMSGITGKQWFGVAIAVLGFLSASSGQMSDLLGAEVAKQIASGAAFINGILGSILAALIGQAAIVKDVRAMPGVEHIEVNEKANAVLAKIATDPSEDKVIPVPGKEKVLERIADVG